MNRDCPQISVIMSVYNTPCKYLREAIESILCQSFGDFEFIIVDDKSTDGSIDIIKEYEKKDSRIILIENERNIGLTKSLNRGLSIARGKYIARMDADDISLPERFSKQYNYMEKHSDISVIGAYTIIDGNEDMINRMFNSNSEIEQVLMLFINAGVAHPTAFIRKSFLDSNSICYDEEIKKSQDYAMWYDVVRKGGVIYCIPEILLNYRVHAGQISKDSKDQMNYAHLVTQRALKDFCGEKDEHTYAIHCSIAEDIPKESKWEYISHLKMLLDANQNGYFDTNIFYYQINCFWLRLCFRRLKYCHRADFLFSLFSLQCINYSTFKHYYYVYIKNKSTYKHVRRKYVSKNERK